MVGGVVRADGRIVEVGIVGVEARVEKEEGEEEQEKKGWCCLQR